MLTQKIIQKNMILVGIIVLVTVTSYQYFHAVQVKYLHITSFKECINAGFKVESSYPEKCIMPGKSFLNPLQTEYLSTNKGGVLTTSNDFKNLLYTINEQQVLFVDGKSVLTSDSAQKVSSTTFEIAGKPFMYDINNDNKEDVVLLLKMTTGDAKQIIYYITSAVALNTGYSGTNALYVDSNLLSSVFLYKNGELVLGYTTKEATTTLREKYFTFTGDILKQISHK